jgi:protein-disulfide isomerase
LPFAAQLALGQCAPPKPEDTMTSFRTFAWSAALTLAAAAMPASAQSLTDQQKQEMGDLIRSYLLEHPEILREMADRLEAKDQEEENLARTEGLAKQKNLVFHHGDAVIGNPEGDVTIVEFMDYNCSWCKRSVAEVQALVEKDKNLKIVFKEFPIFGKHSEFAARAALASVKQGKYWDMHQAMFANEGQVTEDVVMEIAKSLGLDVAKLTEDMKDQQILDTISFNYDLAKTLKLNGTPAFIVDDKVFPGYLPLDQLDSAIAEVRSAGGCKLC